MGQDILHAMRRLRRLLPARRRLGIRPEIRTMIRAGKREQVLSSIHVDVHLPLLASHAARGLPITHIAMAPAYHAKRLRPRSPKINRPANSPSCSGKT